MSYVYHKLTKLIFTGWWKNQFTTKIMIIAKLIYKYI